MLLYNIIKENLENKYKTKIIKLKRVQRRVQRRN